jgi:hypothetical protein
LRRGLKEAIVKEDVEGESHGRNEIALFWGGRSIILLGGSQVSPLVLHIKELWN